MRRKLKHNRIRSSVRAGVQIIFEPHKSKASRKFCRRSKGMSRAARDLNRYLNSE